MAEQAYQGFIKGSESTYPIVDTGRLYRISFRHRKWHCKAEVGSEIVNWPETAGIVLAIIETTNLVFLHTVGRGGLVGGPILVSPNEVGERVYFDDYPSHIEQG
jgi:hypothetical protein